MSPNLRNFGLNPNQPKRVVTPTGTQTVTQANAAYQDQQHTNAIQNAGVPTATLGMQSQGTPVYYGASPENPTGTGVVAYYNNDGAVTGQPVDRSSIIGAPSTALQSPYKTLQPSTGAIQDAERERLRAAGYTDQQIAERESANAPGVRDSATYTGLGASFDPATGRVIPGTGRQEQDPVAKADAAARAASDRARSAGVLDRAELQKIETAAKQASLDESRLQMDTQNSQRQKEQANLGAQAGKGTTALGSAPDMAAVAGDQAGGATDPALEHVLGLLPPGMEFVGELLRSSYAGASDSQSMAASRYTGRVADIEENAETASKRLQKSLDRADETLASAQDLLKSSLDGQDKLLAQKEETDRARLKFQEERDVRKAADDLKDTLEEMNAEIAAGGAIGSSNANDRYREVRTKGEQAITDLQKEYGFKRADLSTFYTDKSVAAHQNFVKDWLAAVDKHEARVDAIDLRFGLNEDKKAELLDKADSDFYAAYEKAVARKADTLEKASKYVLDALEEERKNTRQEEKDRADQEWDRYKFGQQQQMEGLKLQVSQGAREDAAVARMDQQNFQGQQKVVNDITSHVNQDKIITEARGINTRYNSMLSVYENNDIKGKNFPDQILINDFNKLTDDSTVKEAEYARSAEGLNVIESLKAKVQKVGVGGVLTPEARKELMDTARTLYNSYQTMLNERQQPFLLQLGSYNKKLPPEYQVTPEMVGLTQTSSTTNQRVKAESLAPAGLFPSPQPKGGGESPAALRAASSPESAGSDLTEFGRITQGYSTPVASRANGGLYDEHTVSAWGGKHAGIDVAMPEGTRLPSVVSGTVVSASSEGGWGKTVVIKDAGGALHRYSHLSGFEDWVKPGAPIQRGQFIGFSGNTGNSTGPHLDYRIKLNGKYVDPFEYSLLS